MKEFLDGGDGQPGSLEARAYVQKEGVSTGLRGQPIKQRIFYGLKVRKLRRWGKEPLPGPYRYFVGVPVLEVLLDDGRDRLSEVVLVQRQHHRLIHAVLLYETRRQLLRLNH